MCECVADFSNKHTNLHSLLAGITGLSYMYSHNASNLNTCQCVPCIYKMTKCSFVTFYCMCRISSVMKVPRYPVSTIWVSLSIFPSLSVCLSVFLPIFVCFLTTAYLFLRVSVRWVRSPCIFVLFVKTLEEVL